MSQENGKIQLVVLINFKNQFLQKKTFTVLSLEGMRLASAAQTGPTDTHFFFTSIYIYLELNCHLVDGIIRILGCLKENLNYNSSYWLWLYHGVKAFNALGQISFVSLF